eukprot:NODE_35_length_36362_cov_0.944434.p28 type:complete len:160 gc:universal NODE_35_length_36362_cov_0.944434:27980-28459(+)
MEKLASALKPQVATELFGFLKQHQTLKQKVTQLKSQLNVKLDFTPKQGDYGKHVKQAEQVYKSFKPKSVDTSVALENISKFEKVALKRAEETSKLVSQSVSQYKECLQNISKALPVEELTLKDVEKAFPEVDEKVTELANKGEWYNENYYGKFGSMRIF